MIRGKTSRQDAEFRSNNLNKKLLQILYWLDNYVQIEYPNYYNTFGGITLTDIFRTPEEYKKIYNDPNKQPGIHTYWRAVDIRTHDMTQDMINKIVLLLQQFTYDPARPEIKTCVYGDAMHTDHIHLQVKET